MRLLLEKETDIQVVGEAADGQQSVREAKRLKPDVVVQDLAMPLLNGFGAARQIAKELPTTKVLILSAYNDDQYIDHAIEAGAAGYLMKETVGDDLVRGIREVANGNAFFSPAVARRLLKSRQGRSANGNETALATKATVLTGRQTEILQLIA